MIVAVFQILNITVTTNSSFSDIPNPFNHWPDVHNPAKRVKNTILVYSHKHVIRTAVINQNTKSHVQMLREHNVSEKSI